MNHPRTEVVCTWPFDKSRFLSNIPQPAFIAVDEPRKFSPSKFLTNIYIQLEPNAMQNDEEYLISNQHKYHTIFTYNTRILNSCSNAKFYLYGTTWISRDYYMNIDISKKVFQISAFSGSKVFHNAPGHLFRIKIHHNQHLLLEFPITFFRSSVQLPHLPDYGDNPFIYDSKIPLFDTFQFSIIIENSQQENYFTEKIVDCLITKTIPIYWGCPNISDFFNTDGWIFLNSNTVEELADKIKDLSSDYYLNYINIIEENYIKAKYYSDLYDNLNRAN